MLRSTIIIVRFCKGLLQEDDDSAAWAGFMGLEPILRAGALSIAVVSILSTQDGTDPIGQGQLEGCQNDAIVIGRMLDKMARLFGPLVQKIASNYRLAMVQAAIVLPGSLEEVGRVGSAQDLGRIGLLSENLVVIDQLVTSWIS
jgi:hypothetical protein